MTSDVTYVLTALWVLSPLTELSRVLSPVALVYRLGCDRSRAPSPAKRRARPGAWCAGLDEAILSERLAAHLQRGGGDPSDSDGFGSSDGDSDGDEEDAAIVSDTVAAHVARLRKKDL